MKRTSTRRWARLTLTITHGKISQHYLLQGIQADPEVAQVGWRLHKIDRRTGAVSDLYDVHQDAMGLHYCTCADFIFKHQGDDNGCKHIAALRAVKILFKRIVPAENLPALPR